MKEGLPFTRDLSLENSADSYLCFRLALLHLVPYFFFLYQSSSSSLCTVFDFISSNIDQVLSINPGLPFLEELIDLVNSVIISQTTLLRWLKVTSAIKLFFAITQPLKLCLILEISRFFCICEVHRF